MEPSFGPKIAYYRQRLDLTQADVERLTGGRVKRSYLAKIETNQITLLPPGTFNELHRLLKFPGYELLEAMGYETDAGEERVESALLVAAQALPESTQRLLAHVARVMACG